LWHIALHEECGLAELNLPSKSRRYFIPLVERFTGRSMWRYTGQRPKAPEQLIDWAESTRYVKDWLKSSRALRAPGYWPEQVEDAFGLYVPMPWEVANAVPMCLNNTDDWYGHDVSVLVAYACGMGVYELCRITEVNEWAVLSHMTAGARRLMELPQFKLWAMNLDWSRLIGISLQGESPQVKKDFFDALKNNPMGLSKRDVDKAMESIVFRYSTESSMTPARREHRPIHKHVMITEPR
jgi:hypothetical protein